MDEIKKIYLGLPQDMRTRVFWVGRKYRTNLLSHQPGGGDIIVEYHSGKVFGYDWIKYPSRYVSNIFIKQFKKANENFETFKENIQLGIIKKEVSRLFARVYEEDEFETVNFEEVWNSEIDEKLPWDKLKEFEDIKYKERVEKQKKQRIQLKMVAEQEAEYFVEEIPKTESNKYQKPIIDLSQFIKPKVNSNTNTDKTKRRRRVTKPNSSYRNEIKQKRENKNINSLEHLLPKEIVDKLKNAK